jgi:hypothetical protein
MLSSCAPILYILMVWWISTGVILYLGRQPRALHRGFMWAASAVMLAALWGVAVSRHDPTAPGQAVHRVRRVSRDDNAFWLPVVPSSIMSSRWSVHWLPSRG